MESKLLHCLSAAAPQGDGGPLSPGRLLAADNAALDALLDEIKAVDVLAAAETPADVEARR